MEDNAEADADLGIRYDVYIPVPTDLNPCSRGFPSMGTIPAARRLCLHSPPFSVRGASGYYEKFFIGQGRRSRSRCVWQVLI